ncbi:MAG: mechanosensitive ion channel family protein [Desulfobacterales bacterium]|jgi:small-conductance mechanosensitive channel
MNRWLEFFTELQTRLPDGPPYLVTAYHIILVVAGFLVVWMILRALLHFVEKRISKYEFIQINTQVFKLIRRVTFLALVFVAGTYFFRSTRVPILEKIFHALLIIFLALPAKNFLAIAIGYLQKKIAHQTESKIDDIVFELLARFSGIIILATAVIISLDLLGLNVVPFIAGAGVAGVAIGFAAKDTLSNLIAGILLIIDRPFEVGDRIEVWSAPAGTATWGDVIDIGLRATKIKTTDNIVIINYTTITEKIRLRINIGIAYDADMQTAKDIILSVADATEWVAKEPPPVVVVKNFGDSSVDLQLRVWIDDARKRMRTISNITDRVKTAFDEQGIEIPYPKRDIYIKGKI